MLLMFLVALHSTSVEAKCFIDSSLKSLPDNHLFHKLEKPVVIGFKGRSHRYQENSLEGILDLLLLHADGVHMQVQLTSDNQVILFADQDFKRMTGESFKVRSLPYSEVMKMNLKKIIKEDDWSHKSLKYDSVLKIPLLSDVLKKIKDQKKLIYIELMAPVPPSQPLDRHRAVEGARLVGNLVKELNVENNVFIVSRDAISLYALNSYHPQLPSSWWFLKDMFENTTARSIKTFYNDLSPIYAGKCFDNSYEGFPFAKFLLTSGLLCKAVNGSFVDFPLDIYTDDRYVGKDVKKMIEKNYGSAASVGVLSNLKTNNQVNVLVKQGVSRFVTDDVAGVRKSLKRDDDSESSCHAQRSSFAIAFAVVMTTICLL